MIRFWSKVDRLAADACWEWQGAVTSTGYGSFRFQGQSLQAHRFAYELYMGKIPDGYFVHHKCHNRRCVNPNHLEALSPKQNVKEAIDLGSHVIASLGARWVAGRRKKLSILKATEIRRRLAQGEKAKGLAEEFEVSKATISQVKNRKEWI